MRMIKPLFAAPVFALLIANTAPASVPPRAPKPAPPTAITLPSLDAAMCEKTPGEEAIMQPMIDVQTAGAANDRQNEALLDWKAARIEAAGAWSKADRMAFARKLLADPVLQASMTRKQSLMTRMMQTIGAYDTTMKRGEPKLACVQFVDGFRPIMAESAQNATDWLHIQGLYDAEAKRLGVSLAE